MLRASTLSASFWRADTLRLRGVIVSLARQRYLSSLPFLGLGQRPKLDFHLMDFVFYSLDETQC